MARSAISPGSTPTAKNVPSHIVLFRQVSEKNVPMLRSALKLETRRSGASAKTSAGITALGRDDAEGAKVYHDLGCASAKLTPEEAEKLNKSDEVEAVFPNEVRHIPRPVPDSNRIRGAAMPQDSRFDYLRGLRDGIDAALRSLGGEAISLPQLPARPSIAAEFSDSSAMTWGLQAIGLTGASTASAKGIKLAVLDSGFDVNHPDFRGRIVEGQQGKSFVPGETLDQLDDHSHGMHVCGTIAGPLMGSGLRRYGVAPDVDLLVGKVLDSSGSGTDNWILDGIQWASDQGARIISMSLGSARRPNQPYSLVYERVAERLLEGNPGTIIIAAAGNESERPGFIAPVGNPAACPSILSVGAVDEDLRVARFSCGQVDGIGEVNVAAPGVGVYSAITGGYGLLNGTSMATPHVSALAALMLGAEPVMTARELWDKLVIGVRALTPASDFGSGLALLARA